MAFGRNGLTIAGHSSRGASPRTVQIGVRPDGWGIKQLEIGNSLSPINSAVQLHLVTLCHAQILMPENYL